MIPGYSLPGEFEALAYYAAHCPAPWVEVGTYCGRSAVTVGAEARKHGVHLFAVDPHRGNPEMAPGEACHHPDVWAREHGSLSVLIDSIRDHDLEGTVVPVVAPGTALASTGIRPGFVFIDADHSYEGARRDYDDWSPLIQPGGLLCFHDATDVGPGTVVNEAIADGWTHIDQVQSLAVLHR